MACPSCSLSLSGRRARAFARDSTRRWRPSHMSATPLGVASRRMRRASSVAWRRTSPERWSPATIRLMVGGRTCSASASSPSDLGSPNTSTESAESCAGPMPLSRSRTRSRRRRWMAAECNWSARSMVAGSTVVGAAEGRTGEIVGSREAGCGVASAGAADGDGAGEVGAERALRKGRFLCLTAPIRFS